MKKLLIANRGEIAVRILQSAAEMGIRTVAITSEDDAGALHRGRADEAVALRGHGAAAYLDIEQIIGAASTTGCDAIHPGYGFLSEAPRFAAACADAGIVFVGPSVETLTLLGDKVAARALAVRNDVPVLLGSDTSVSVDEARRFLASLPSGAAMMIKAVAGGGGRGMRLVRQAAELESAYERCRSEAEQAFGCGDVYVEEAMPRGRHIEVQILGDGSGAITHLHERECSIQRRHQKLIEIAPCPTLSDKLRASILADAVRMARSLRYAGLGTFEFLVARDPADTSRAYAFIEANPRLQVEHTVTEEVFAIDLVRCQLQLAAGASLAELGLEQGKIAPPRGYAVQMRINGETVKADGSTFPSSGLVTSFDRPSGPGCRVDSGSFVGLRTNPNFDSLFAKLICHSPTGSFADAASRSARALGEMRVEGVDTNLPFLRRIVAHPDFIANRIDIGFVEANLAVLAPDNEAGDTEPSRDSDGATVVAPMQGTIVTVAAGVGDAVARGQVLLVMSAMKMEHEITAPRGGVLREIIGKVGEMVAESQVLARIAGGADDAETEVAVEEIDRERIRPDLAEARRRHQATADEARPAAVAKRRKIGQRTARENIADLCDAGSFVEYGGLAIAAQRQRRSLDDLLENTPADGLVAGIGRINTEWIGEEAASCLVLSYDYTVLAGTQGYLNHRKKDRLFEVAQRLRTPVVFFTEGGGGRPGDTDVPGVAGLDCMAFRLFAELSGRVPLVGINSGRCFAGNAALLGCCDVIIATRGSHIGMGGPAMIEGGGLGIFRPEEIGPLPVQIANGVVDVAVDDDAAAVEVAKKYLSYFQGRLARWECGDQRLLRGAIPENRLRVYEVRTVIDGLADRDSVLELRRGFGRGVVTALARIEGRPLGIIANDPKHLAGAIDSDGADKAARFMRLCDAFGLPILFLCDTPGIMVGPDAEKTGLVRHAARMFVVGAGLRVPFGTIVLRKAYGLGAQAMGGGSHKAPLFTVSWPTGEFGGMGLEGAVKLGFRKELEAVTDREQRQALFDQMVARAYQRGGALNTASHFEIDDVIDPADSRRWVRALLWPTQGPSEPINGRGPGVDPW